MINDEPLIIEEDIPNPLNDFVLPFIGFIFFLLILNIFNYYSNMRLSKLRFWFLIAISFILGLGFYDSFYPLDLETLFYIFMLPLSLLVLLGILHLWRLKNKIAVVLLSIITYFIVPHVLFSTLKIKYTQPIEASIGFLFYFSITGLAYGLYIAFKLDKPEIISRGKYIKYGIILGGLLGGLIGFLFILFASMPFMPFIILWVLAGGFIGLFFSI